MGGMETHVAAYLAGIVDGEGNIGLVRRNANPQRGEIAPTFYDYLKIVNTDYRLLSWIREKVGYGKISVETRKKEGHRKVYTWHVSSRPMRQFLQEVYPYLLIKRDQADLIFKFRATFDKSRECRKGVPPEVLKMREQYCVEMVNLHKTVVHGPPLLAGPQTTEVRRAAQQDVFGSEMSALEACRFFASGHVSARKVRKGAQKVVLPTRYRPTVGGRYVVINDMPEDGYELKSQAHEAARRYKQSKRAELKMLLDG
jgi:hypothetical protein